ncbi:hypothetical protein Btru_020120 [Bulinus truncatus]|nr:hypothetical protein Btru_020120 [Bulinus truncatus]
MCSVQTKYRTTLLLYVLWNLLSLAISIPCNNESPISELAYFGIDEIRFPDSSINSAGQPTQCRWRIMAFRKDYVVNLEFSDVNLTLQDYSDVCSEKVIVYDGSEVTDSVLADICGVRNPSFVTSSRETLIVFQSNESKVISRKFRLKYRAVKDRINDDDSSQILRIAFGGFIGAVAFVVICSGAIRRFKHGRPHRSAFFFFGRHRIDTSIQPVSGGARTSGGSTRGNHDVMTLTPPNGPALQDATGSSFRNRVSGFFHEIIIKLTPRHLDVESSTSDSSEYSSSLHHSSRALFRFGHHRSTSLTSCTGTISAHGGRSSNSNSNAVDSEFDSSHHHHTLPLPEHSVDGHESFDYGTIPITSFTSDPEAVKPPTYEDCVNSVNPLYLHYGGGGRAFYNRAFDLKDEGHGSCSVLSPPPPYSEINRQIQLSSPIATRGNDTGSPTFQAACTGQRGCGNSAHSNHPAIATDASSMPPVSTVQCFDTTNEPLLISGAACCLPDVIEVAEKENKQPGLFQPVDLTPKAEKSETGDSTSNEVNPCHPRADVNAPMELIRRSGFISGPHAESQTRPHRMTTDRASDESNESRSGGLINSIPQQRFGSQLSPLTESDTDGLADESTNDTSAPGEMLLVVHFDPNNSEQDV